MSNCKQSNFVNANDIVAWIYGIEFRFLNQLKTLKTTKLDWEFTDGCVRIFPKWSQRLDMTSFAVTIRKGELEKTFLKFTILSFFENCSYESMRCLVGKYNQVIDTILNLVSLFNPTHADLWPMFRNLTTVSTGEMFFVGKNFDLSSHYLYTFVV